MLISATPIFSSMIDKGTILQVVMQLEIETTSKGNTQNEDLHDSGTKFFNTTSSEYPPYLKGVENNSKQKHYLKNEISICAFHPAVPTPPPNC